MIRLSEKDKQAISRLRQNKDFEVFLDVLIATRDEKDANNRIAIDVPLYRSQGAALELTDIINVIVGDS